MYKQARRHGRYSPRSSRTASEQIRITRSYVILLYCTGRRGITINLACFSAFIFIIKGRVCALLYTTTHARHYQISGIILYFNFELQARLFYFVSFFFFVVLSNGCTSPFDDDDDTHHRLNRIGSNIALPGFRNTNALNWSYYTRVK